MALDELNDWLAKNEVRSRVVFTEPATSKDVAKAEKSLKLAFPPSYKAFVTTHGTFTISGSLTGRGEGNDTELLGPAQAAKETLGRRKELNKYGDDDSKEIINDGLIFCADPCDEFFHLFVVSSADAEGEMKTRGYDYQYPARTDAWFEGDGTFASVIDAIIARVRERALGYES